LCLRYSIGMSVLLPLSLSPGVNGLHSAVHPQGRD
jgi:hypothetical protein